MKYLLILFLCVTGCSHISPYGHGCRDGVKGLEPQLGPFGAALADGDSLDKYCDAVEKKNTKQENLSGGK